jgi:GNAT superfamily N-acetyltransferase
MPIRPYQEADRPSLRTLYLAARQAAFTWRDTRSYRLEDFDRSTIGEEIWVAEQDGRLLGFVSIYRAEDFIHHLYVDPQQPPQGVGSALLHTAERTFTSTGSLKCLVKNDKALAFYHKHGWQIVATGGDGGEEYYLMHGPRNV